MVEFPTEELRADHRNYVLTLLKKTRDALKDLKRFFGNRVKQIEELIEKIEKGEFDPSVYVLEPGMRIRWYGQDFAPVTEIWEDVVVHRGKDYRWTSSRIHRGDGFHVIGRLMGKWDAGYVAIKEEKGEPVISVTLAGLMPVVFRKVSESDALVSRLHGILAPHPEEKGKFIYVHLGRNKPKVERMK